MDVEIDLYLTLLAAVGIGDGSALDRGESRTNGVGAVVVELRLGEALPGQTELKYRHARSVVLNDERRRRSRRQRTQLDLGDRRDLGNSAADVDVGLEIDLDYGDAVQRLRFNVLDVVDGGGEAALAGAGDAVGHLFRGETGVLPNHADDRDIDIRENIDRSALDDYRPQEEQQQRFIWRPEAHRRFIMHGERVFVEPTAPGRTGDDQGSLLLVWVGLMCFRRRGCADSAFRAAAT